MLALPFALWLCKRLVQLKSFNSHLVAEAEQNREILASTTDGLFLWDHKNAIEKCSRRLAVLLRLDAGTEANFNNILEKFSDREAVALAEATVQLHQKGTSFNLLLKMDKCTIQATGTRTYKLDGSPLNDLIWMRDITNEPSIHHTPDHPKEGAQEHFRQLLDTLPLPVWIRDSALTVVFSNSSESLLKASQTSKKIAKIARSKNEAVSELIYIDNVPFNTSEIPAYGWNGTIGFAEKKVTKNDNPDIWNSNATVKQVRNEVLENLSTAIVIFDSNKRAFTKMSSRFHLIVLSVICT